MVIRYFQYDKLEIGIWNKTVLIQHLFIKVLAKSVSWLREDSPERVFFRIKKPRLEVSFDKIICSIYSSLRILAWYIV